MKGTGIREAGFCMADWLEVEALLSVAAKELLGGRGLVVNRVISTLTISCAHSCPTCKSVYNWPWTSK